MRLFVDAFLTFVTDYTVRFSVSAYSSPEDKFYASADFDSLKK